LKEKLALWPGARLTADPPICSNRKPLWESERVVPLTVILADAVPCAGEVVSKPTAVKSRIPMTERMTALLCGIVANRASGPSCREQAGSASTASSLTPCSWEIYPTRRRR
jgi:hypothetical protein